MKKALLSLQNITLHADLRSLPIIDDLFLDIYPGDFIIVLGSNGSGKSSLISLINGLYLPTIGRILHQGRDLKSDSVSKRSQSIVTLTQDLNLSTFSQMTVFENCLISMERNRRFSFSLSKKNEREKIAAYLRQFNENLPAALDCQISSLSGGERQTLAFAMSLWSSPSLLLLDEHTSALDPYMAKKLMHLTYEKGEKQGITTLMTTHHLDDALQFGNRLILMRQGKIVLDANREDKLKLTKQELLTYYKEV